jgi:hypothetical protein
MSNHDHHDHDHHHHDHDHDHGHEQVGRGPHDVGGLPSGRPHKEAHTYQDWERRIDSIRLVLSGRYDGTKVMSVDELRGNIEGIAPEAYAQMSYYERWITAISKILLSKGVITTEELSTRIAEVEARLTGKRA